ncbi:MAG: DUF302 domain-containing protein [Deltaproteobacteria bacterium]|nr:DUF302 domain-containing protein [Deltaproteobacteria bacterium]
MIHYSFTKDLNLPYEAVVEKVMEALKEEGFGTLTEIDGKVKLKEKLGVDSRKYLILGACNPRNAFMSILAEENIGLTIPCSVIVYEKADKTAISVLRPTLAMEMIDNPDLRKIAETVERHLKKAFDAVNEQE